MTLNTVPDNARSWRPSCTTTSERRRITATPVPVTSAFSHSVVGQSQAGEIQLRISVNHRSMIMMSKLVADKFRFSEGVHNRSVLVVCRDAVQNPRFWVPDTPMDSYTDIGQEGR
jgi:hypothetical protein